MTRLVRIRHKPLPEGVQAFAWPLPSGNVIVYVDPSLSRRERARAVRGVLGKTRVNRAAVMTAMVPAAIAPELRKHGQAIGASAAAITLAAAIGVGIASTGGTPTIHKGFEAKPPVLVPAPSPTHARHHKHASKHRSAQAPSLPVTPAGLVTTATQAKPVSMPHSTPESLPAPPVAPSPSASSSPARRCLLRVRVLNVVRVRVCG